MATTFVWTRWLPPQAESIGAGVLATIWILAWIEGRADVRRRLAELSREGDVDPAQQSDQRFRLALKHYLAGDWVAAEQELAKLLKLDARDAEACLLLATMWRRLERPRDACQMLDRLERLEAAGPWQAEIRAERRLLESLLPNNERPPEHSERTNSNAETPDAETPDAETPDAETPDAETRHAADFDRHVRPRRAA